MSKVDDPVGGLEDVLAGGLEDDPEDAELYLSNDDYDVEIELESDDADKNGSNKKGGKNGKKENDPEDEPEEEVDDGDDIINTLPIKDKYTLNDIIDEMKEPPHIKTNKLYTGIVDPVKYKIIQDRMDVEEYIVPPDKRKTSHILGKAEKTELLGIRAQHISMGAKVYVDVESESDPIKIAEKEMKQQKFPLLLKRRLNKFTFEVWDPNMMTVIWQD